MSPFRRDCIDDNDCNNGIRPSTYATVIAVVGLFFLFVFCFCLVRKRRTTRLVRETHMHPYNRPMPTPFTSGPDYLPHHVPSPPPPPAFEPAPPYEPKPAVPIQYPPPSYAPGQ
ncbi:hypothetical protein DXG01_005886 [Tephrocybe rancida]|nr:hypothetical protein DXG01_005886 [Tephrocybe rancida]